MLNKGEQNILLTDWATEILNSMQIVCEILDNTDETKPYSVALDKQRAVVNNPDLTPAARILAAMTESKIPYARFALNKSREHAEHFKASTLASNLQQTFTDMAKQSIAKQHDIERMPQVPFEQFLSDYFSQT